MLVRGTVEAGEASVERLMGDEESSAKLGLFIWGPSVFHVPPAGVGVFMVNAQALYARGKGWWHPLLSHPATTA